MAKAKISDFIDATKPKIDGFIEKAQAFVAFMIKEYGSVGTFVGYDTGLGVPREEMGNYTETQTGFCNQFDVGILDQGMFQASTFDVEMWSTMRKYVIDEQADISQVNFFLLQTSLTAAVNPILTFVPVVNVFHSSIGVQFIGKNGQIKRNAILQLEFGAFDNVGDLANRFFCPQFCMGPVIQEDGTAKNPLTFTDKEFSTNLFIDYSHSTSAVMGNFLETADYVTDQLVHEMGCVDSAVALGSANPIPYKDFLGQMLPMSSFYAAYDKYRNSKDLNLGGPADGTIFLLAAFGPSPLSQTAGEILHFATCTDTSDVLKILDFVFVNYNGCSNTKFNSNQFYSMVGIEKLISTKGMTSSEISNFLKRPTVWSTEDGTIREVMGRPTHCNTVCAVIVTLIDHLAESKPSAWTIHTDWGSQRVQRSSFYMTNPAIPMIPLWYFPPGWENGVTMEALNNDPRYISDKKSFYQGWFFIRMMANNLVNVGVTNILVGSAVSSTNMFQTILFYAFEVLGSGITAKIVELLHGPMGKYNYMKQLTIIFVAIFAVVKFNLFEEIYWAAGQSTSNPDGSYNVNMVDPAPTIFKIDVRRNGPLIEAYIQKFLGSLVQDVAKQATVKTLGEILYDITTTNETPSRGVEWFNQMNYWIHPLPMNKFHLWFPGIRANNKCSLVPELDYFAFAPHIVYRIVGPNETADINFVRPEPEKPVLQCSPDTDGQKGQYSPIMVTIFITIAVLCVLLQIHLYSRLSHQINH